MSEVCQCKDKDHTVSICIGQCEEAMGQVDKWFTMLTEHCEHNVMEMCHKYSGVMSCKLEQCPLINA